MAANIAEGLIRLMPDREQQISENLRAYQERLYALDETLRDGLAGFGRKVIIFHEALPYFAEACGLSAAAIVNKEPDDTLPTAQLARVTELISAEENMPLILKSVDEDPSDVYRIKVGDEGFTDYEGNSLAVLQMFRVTSNSTPSYLPKKNENMYKAKTYI